MELKWKDSSFDFWKFTLEACTEWKEQRHPEGRRNRGGPKTEEESHSCKTRAGVRRRIKRGTEMKTRNKRETRRLVLLHPVEIPDWEKATDLSLNRFENFCCVNMPPGFVSGICVDPEPSVICPCAKEVCLDLPLGFVYRIADEV